MSILRGSRYYGHKAPRDRDYVREPYENNPQNYPGEANKSNSPNDDEEFIPQQVAEVKEHTP